MKLQPLCQLAPRLALVFAAGLLLLLATGLASNTRASGDSPLAPAALNSAQPRVYRLYFASRAELQQALALIESPDVLGVDLKEQFAVLTLSAAEADHLQRRGYRLELDERTSGHQLSAWSGEYYTYSRLTTDLADIAARFPSIARLYDLGPTWETIGGRADRRLWALRISRNPVGKPQVLFVANEHAREIATVEIAMRLAKQLLEGYGSDPEATFLVDNRDTWIVPMVNPDGHVQVEQGSSMKRKNANTTNGLCYEPNWGVDLNRNFPYMWGPPGSSSYPCDETYRGPLASSEPETQAIMGLVSGNSFVFLMDYHSFSNLILWPWGYTTGTSGVNPRLPAVGRKLAQLTARNGSSPYTPEQGSALYLTSGSLLDWAYATKNVLAFTTEIGSYDDWFDPPYSRVETFWAENAPPALYLLNIADDPGRVYGPEATGARVSPDLVDFTGTITLTATVSDLGNGDLAIASAEYFVDSPGANGAGVALAAADGAFDSPSEVVQALIPASTLGIGRHTLLVRGRDAAGNWGSLSMVFVQVDGPYKLHMPVIRHGYMATW